MADKITIIDKLIAATLLKLIPGWVTPNHMTIFRFLMLPFLIFALVNEAYVVGIVLFILAALSDALDGAKARTSNQITEWGKMFDPIADKLLIGTTSAIIISTQIGQVLALIIIVLELFIVTGAFLYKQKYKHVTIEANKVGKAKMIFQSFGIGFLFLFVILGTPILLPIAIWTLYASIFFAVLQLFVFRAL